MHQVLDRLRPLGWNVRVFDEQDFYYLCKQEDIPIIEAESGWLGEYKRMFGVPIILLSPHLRGMNRLWVLAHETAHALLHLPGQRFGYANMGKIERQADLIASCALIPISLFKSKTAFELWEEYGYSPELITLRREVFQCYGM